MTSRRGTTARRRAVLDVSRERVVWSFVWGIHVFNTRFVSSTGFFIIFTLPIIRSFDPFLPYIVDRHRRLRAVVALEIRSRPSACGALSRARASETSSARPNARRRRSPSCLVASRRSSRVSSSRIITRSNSSLDRIHSRVIMRVHFKRANGATVTLDDVDDVAHTVRETRERLAPAMASMGTGEDGGGGGGGDGGGGDDAVDLQGSRHEGRLHAGRVRFDG